MIRYVGLDLHKHLLVVCILDESGHVLARPRLEGLGAASLEAFCRCHLRAEDHVALEATTNSWAVARALAPHVARVVVSNPLATKAIAQAKVKTDKVDALALAQLLRCGYLPEVWQPDAAQQRLREWTARRSRLVSQRTALVNRIRGTLAMRLLDCPHDICSPPGRDWLAAAALDDDARWLVDSDARLLDAVAAEIAAIDQRLAQRGYDDPRVKLLMTLPGVSQHTAQSLLAAIGDLRRFRTAKALASYLGLVPSTRQSAAKCYHGSITKAGRGHTRWMLVQAAQSVREHPGPLGFFFRRLKKKKNHNIAVVAVAHKLALLAWHVLHSGAPYRYAVPRTTEVKLARLRIAATGQRRRGGVARGTDPRTTHAPGAKGRTQRSLPALCAAEGLPPPTPAPPGEQAHLARLDLATFAAQLAETTILPRTQKTQKQPTPTS
jgi:transposase